MISLRLDSELEKRAQEFIKHASKDWLKVTGRCSKFYSVTAKLENTPEVRALGHIIAYLLKQQYDFYSATYHEDANCIIAHSKID